MKRKIGAGMMRPERRKWKKVEDSVGTQRRWNNGSGDVGRRLEGKRPNLSVERVEEGEGRGVGRRSEGNKDMMKEREEGIEGRRKEREIYGEKIARK